MKIARILGVGLIVGTIGISVAHAETAWQRQHPVRTGDNIRLNEQNRRITQGVRDGQLTHSQAQALRNDDRAIRAEERSDAAVNGTHLNRQDQRAINAQENANSRAIEQARHP